MVFHSDRGTQYTSDEFQKWCGTNRVTQSMGKVGVCWDNAVAENFFSHLKTEFYHHERTAPGSLPAPASWTTSKAGTTAAGPTAEPAASHQRQHTQTTTAAPRNPWPPNRNQQRPVSKT